MKLKDVKTSTQLLMGFGAVLVFMLTLSVISWQQTNRMAQKINFIYNHSLTVRRALAEFHQSVLNMRIEFRNVMLTANEDLWNMAVRNREIKKDNALQQFDSLYERYTGDRADIDSLRVYFLSWSLLQQQAIKNSSTEKTDETLLQRTETGDIALARNRLLSQINKIDNYSRNKADQFYDESIQLKHALNNQLLIFTLAVFALSLLIVTYLSRVFNNPLKEITRAADLYRSGNKTARSNYASKNLLGKLSETFNEMAGTLETEYLISSRAADLTGIMLSEDDAHSFCRDLLKNLLEHTQSQMGAVYLLNDDKTLFERFECIGMDAAGCKPFSAIHPEGEFGLALAAKRISHLKNIPLDSQFNFNTVSGSFKPREIITIPIFNSNEAVAVISIFSIHCYSEINIRLINNIFNTLTARMNGILAYKQVLEFSKKLEEQNTELDVQKNELTRMADELKEQNTELEMQKNQLGEASRLKTIFLSNMSHELRTPLNSVIALSGVLNRRLGKMIPAEEYSYLEVIERNGKHLLALINDILDISRIEAGREEVEITTFNPCNLINEVVSMIEPQAQQKNIGLLKVIGDCDGSITSDATKCRHILQNLISNAVKFTEKGKVEIKAAQSGQYIAITVTDTGIGISEEHLTHIFDEFRQADSSTSRRFGGTGLGLAIAQKYANLLGGSITVKSAPGKGSEFTLMLPLSYVAANRIIESETTTGFNHSLKKTLLTPAAGLSNKTILLVEDSEPAIIQMKDFLEESGYQILVARDGAEALAIIDKTIPDAMILDLMMPGIDGFEVLRIVREAERTILIPVLILSAKHITKEELRFLKRNNIHQLIQKGNVNQNDLLNAVAAMVTPEKTEPKPEQSQRELQTIEGKPVVLVVEDNPDNMTTAKAILTGNYTVIEATDGKSGIEMALKNVPHLILMDIELPGMDGISAFKAIRNNDRLQHIPVVALTASAMTSDRETILAHGFDAYIAKPIDEKVFLKTINTMLYGK